MIKYKKRRKYKYSLVESYSYPTGIAMPKDADLGFLSIDCAGNLSIKKGYAWDGPSGPTVDTRNFMRGSLVHDALYQLMREGKLNRSREMRFEVDRILEKVCVESGMPRLRARLVYWGVRLGGRRSTRSDTLEAP